MPGWGFLQAYAQGLWKRPDPIIEGSGPAIVQMPWEGTP